MKFSQDSSPIMREEFTQATIETTINQQTHTWMFERLVMVMYSLDILYD
jgi:hypothetical protein